MAVVINLNSVLLRYCTTLEEVAERSTFTKNQLEALCRGYYSAIRLSTIEKLCSAIGCEPGELFIKIP